MAGARSADDGGVVNDIPLWVRTHRADPATRELADRHYNRQKIGAVGFVPPGRCLVLLKPDQTAFWVTSYPFAKYVKHAWAGAWVCSAFRNEGDSRASDLILSAVAMTRGFFGDPPPLGMVTFVDRRKVRPTTVRGKPTWGRTYLLAGFEIAGETRGGLLALRLPPERCPPAVLPRTAAEIWAEADL